MSNSNISISVKNVSKSYKLYKKPSDRLREVLHPFRKSYHIEFSALKDISFEIPKGQILGIVGKNGSGKSTLLKILTGILTPTTGQVHVDGRISALLELGAGFNPELTGMENIFLNGSLMGISEKEMLSKVADIIEFADIGEFIHQPVKMYSSGMFVRLAFAVAINVDPDILIIDEALSVGDIRFQQKCYRKIQDFFEKGKTVIFVGHDLSVINNFCSWCLWINEGQLMRSGPPKEVTKDYTSFMVYGMTSDVSSSVQSNNNQGWIETGSFESFGDMEATVQALRVQDQNGKCPEIYLGGESVSIDLRVNAQTTIDQPILGFVVKDRLGKSVFGSNNFVSDMFLSAIPKGNHIYRISFPFPHISNGEYLLTLAIAQGNQHDHIQKHWVHDCFVFKVANPALKYRNGDGLVLNDVGFDKIQ